jgi:hypothetical protein
MTDHDESGPMCPKCTREISSYETLDWPEHYYGKHGDEGKVCNECRNEYDNHWKQAMSEMQEEVDEWWDESDWGL